MVFRFFGRFMSVRKLHSIKASSPISSRLSGNVTLTRSVL